MSNIVIDKKINDLLVLSHRTFSYDISSKYKYNRIVYVNLNSNNNTFYI